MANHMASCHDSAGKAMPNRVANDASRGSARAFPSRPVPDVLTSLVLPTQPLTLILNTSANASRELVR